MVSKREVEVAGKKRGTKTVIQNHHLLYEERDGRDWVVPLFRGEHWIITQMERRKRVSKGFLTCLRKYVKDCKGNAIKLSLVKKKGRIRNKRVGVVKK